MSKLDQLRAEIADLKEEFLLLDEQRKEVKAKLDAKVESLELVEEILNEEISQKEEQERKSQEAFNSLYAKASGGNCTLSDVKEFGGRAKFDAPEVVELEATG